MVNVLSAYAADAKSIGLTFNGPVTAAAWSAGMVTADFGLGDLPATSYTQDGANAIVATAAAWDDDTTGAIWRIVTAPAGVVAPESGTVP